MLHLPPEGRPLPLLTVSLCAFMLVASTGVLPIEATAAATQKREGATIANKARPEKSDKETDAPPYHEYKRVRIGMTADEARQTLGNPTDKGDKQDFYVFSDNETAQVFYDGEKKVIAIAVVYIGGGGGVPTPQTIVGGDIEPKADGSLYKMVDYPKAGFWVSYSRTAGDAPITSVTMQKRQ